MGFLSLCIALQLTMVLIGGETDMNDTDNDFDDVEKPITTPPPPIYKQHTTPPRELQFHLRGDYNEDASTSSPEGPGDFGEHDPHPYPTIDSYPESRVVTVGDNVEFECKASDKADHVRGLPKHDLSIEIFFENDPSRDLDDVENMWYEDISTSTKSRPNFITGRTDITETGEVILTKFSVTHNDEGWYVCRACIQEDRQHQSCDMNDARFYLQVLDSAPPVDDGGGDTGGDKGGDGGGDKGEDTHPSDTPGNVVYTTPRSTCQVFGDPHVITFDGHAYTLAGSACHYILAFDAVGSAWFVYGKLGPCGAIAEGFCLESVVVYSPTDGIELQRGWLVNRQGGKVETRDLKEKVTLGEFEVEFKGTNVEVSLLIEEKINERGVTVQDWLIVSWDGMTTVTIESPKNGVTQGLCGNNDQDPDNDLNVWGTPNSDELFFSENLKLDFRRECKPGQASHTAESVEKMCGHKLQKIQRKCRRIFSITPFEWCAHDVEPYYNACVYDYCKGFNINSNLYSWLQIPDVDRVLPPGCAAAEAYARKCSANSWTEEGNIAPAVNTEGWELMTKACATPDVKLEYIPKLGCPQSFM